MKEQKQFHVKHISIFWTTAFYLLLFSCANIVAPTGGDKDVTPPEILSITPENGKTNFHDKQIEVKFNEYIQFSSREGDVIFSPTMENPPTFSTKGKSLLIKIDEPLTENTTYTINFGESIKDWTEGNQLLGFSYVFSTGADLDSASLYGKVLNAIDNTPQEGIKVMLYPTTVDSFLIKEKPLYVVNTDASGQFVFHHLKEGQYNIAALNDKNSNYIYDQNTEEIAFFPQEINIPGFQDIIAPLYLFQEQEKAEVKVLTKEKGHLVFALGEKIRTIQFDTELYQENDLVYLNKTNDSLHYWYQDILAESAMFYISIDGKETDSLSVDLRKASEKIFTFNARDEVNIKDTFSIKTSFPIQAWDKTKMTLIDSIGQLIPFTLSLAEKNLEIKIAATWQEGNNYTFSLKEGAFIDFKGEQIEEVDLFFTATNSMTENHLILDITASIDTKNMFVVLLDSQKRLLATQTISPKISFENYPPGKYFVKIYRDDNHDGEWSTGSFSERRLPEEVLFNSKEIDLKSNWDKEISITF